MAMVANEKESACLRHIDLHPDKTVGMARKVVQCDPLTEVHSLIIKSLPVSKIGVSLRANCIAEKTYSDRFR